MQSPRPAQSAQTNRFAIPSESVSLSSTFYTVAHEPIPDFNLEEITIIDEYINREGINNLSDLLKQIVGNKTELKRYPDDSKSKLKKIILEIQEMLKTKGIELLNIKSLSNKHKEIIKEILEKYDGLKLTKTKSKRKTKTKRKSKRKTKRKSKRKSKNKN